MFGFSAYVSALSIDCKVAHLRGKGFVASEKVHCQPHTKFHASPVHEQECIVIRGFDLRTDNFISYIYPLSLSSAVEAFLFETDSIQIRAIFPVQLQGYQVIL